LSKGGATPERFRELFLKVIQADIEDGLVFDAESLDVATMRDDQKYSGIRVSVLAYLDKARINLQVDIGFGDATTPEPASINFPVLLNFPAPQILAYQKETVIAEKFQAMVDLGIANSRMKDFFDIWNFAKQFEFDGNTLAEAIKATFDRRETQIPTEHPLALTSEFWNDSSKQKQWNAFVNKLNLVLSLEEATSLIERFVVPCIVSIRENKPFNSQWSNQDWNPN